MALVLVGSSLTLRRLPAGNILKLVLIWVALFVGAFLAVGLVTSWS